MKLGNYSFIFGIGFLREVNKHNVITADGIQIKMGLQNLTVNLLNRDMETLFDTLKWANKTESPRIKDNELETLIAETDDIDELFEEVVEAMSESNFTKEVVEKAKSVMAVTKKEA